MLDLSTCTLAPGEVAEIQLPDGSIWRAQAQGGVLWLASAPVPHPQGTSLEQLAWLCKAMALQDRAGLGRGGRFMMDEHGHLRLQWPWPARADAAAVWESARRAHQQYSAALQGGLEPPPPSPSPTSSPSSPPDSQMAEDVFEQLQALLELDPALADLVHADAVAREVVIEPEHEQWALALLGGAGPGEARIVVPIDSWPVDEANALERVHAALTLNAGTYLGPAHWVSVEFDGTEGSLWLYSYAPVVGAQLDDVQAALGATLSLAQELKGPAGSSRPAPDPGAMAGSMASFMGLRG